MVIAYSSPVTSISYRSWMSLEICEDPVLLVNVAINLLCLYRSVWILFYLNIFEYVFVPRAQRRLTPEWITFLGKIIYIFLGSGFVCISPCLNSLLTFNSKQKRQIRPNFNNGNTQFVVQSWFGLKFGKLLRQLEGHSMIKASPSSLWNNVGWKWSLINNENPANSVIN